MSVVSELYRHSLALLTDLYELTMAQGYWKLELADREAVFVLSYRTNPFGGGFGICSGLGSFLGLLEGLHYGDDDLAYLATLKGNDGRGLFDRQFLDYLGGLKFRCDIDAVAEGSVVFPHEPLLRVNGPILHCQLLETVALNAINFGTLIATRAARTCLAAAGEPVVEFGLRRAQGFDGGLAAARAAFIGGCAGTSNVLAGKLLGIPVFGTMAHSWVMVFDDEQQAFDAWAQAMPNNCLLLVDTYDTLAGVDRAIRTGLRLRERGGRLIGVRLDSGDLAYLSIEACRRLHQAGLDETNIFGTHDLDEHVITSLHQQGARIDSWGVGTRLVTGYDQPAVDGTYKLTAIRDGGGRWRHKLKLSEQKSKTSTPGMLQVRRFHGQGEYLFDMIYDELLGLETPLVMIDPLDETRRKVIDPAMEFEDLLTPVVRQGQPLAPEPPLADLQARQRQQLGRFHSGIKRLLNAHQYPVGLERQLYELKTRMILEARGLPKDPK